MSDATVIRDISVTGFVFFFFFNLILLQQVYYSHCRLSYTNDR
jgi:hypothetical protein